MYVVVFRNWKRDSPRSASVWIFMALLVMCGQFWNGSIDAVRHDAIDDDGGKLLM